MRIALTEDAEIDAPSRGFDRRDVVRCEQGAALLEFALVLPIIIALGVGCVEVGRILLAYSAVENAVRGGTRFLAQVPNPTCNPACSWGAARAIAMTRDAIAANTDARDAAIRVVTSSDSISDTVTIEAEVDIAAIMTGGVGAIRLWTVKASREERKSGP